MNTELDQIDIKNTTWLTSQLKELINSIDFSKDPELLIWQPYTISVYADELYHLKNMFTDRLNKVQNDIEDLCLIDFSVAPNAELVVDEAFIAFDSISHQIVQHYDIICVYKKAEEFATLLTALYLCNRYFNIETLTKNMAHIVSSVYIDIKTSSKDKGDDVLQESIEILGLILANIALIEKSYLQ